MDFTRYGYKKKEQKPEYQLIYKWRFVEFHLKVY